MSVMIVPKVWLVLPNEIGRQAKHPELTKRYASVSIIQIHKEVEDKCHLLTSQTVISLRFIKNEV